MKGDIVEVDGKDILIHEERADYVKAVADYCANLRAIGATGSKDMKTAASVPGWVILQWCNLRGVTWADFFADGSKLPDKFLEDPDNRAFRIWEGRI